MKIPRPSCWLVWMVFLRGASTMTIQPQTKTKIAILGAGASGLTTARAFVKGSARQQQQQQYEVTVFEQRTHLGGVWKYQTQTSPTQPMYRHLRTNLPKELMQFREHPWKNNNQNSFVTHTDVQDYLQSYCDHFGLEPHIRYHAKVQSVKLLENNDLFSAIRVHPDDGHLPRWQVTYRDTHSQQETTDVFDGVVVCNGHYNEPSLPNVPGLPYFRGRSMHSIEYDTPEGFHNQTVLCVGGRASGSDIAREVCRHAQHVYLSDTTMHQTQTIQNTTWCPKTEQIDPDGNVLLANGDVLSNIDVIIWCTGYDYQFDFLQDEGRLELDASDRRVQPLFAQLWHATYPNLAFVGLPHSVVPFPLFELQAQAVEASWRKGRTVLPNLQERTVAAQLDAQSGGACHGRVPQDTHYLGDAQWDYCKQMAQYAGTLDFALEEYLEQSKDMYNHVSAQRKGVFPCGPDTYREINYRRDDNGKFDVQLPPALLEATKASTSSS